MIAAKFPGITVPFHESGGIFARFGQNPRLSGLTNVKFTAKFPEAGNFKLQHVSQFLVLPLASAALPMIVFHSIFPQSVH
jgi:hypothetical protein